MTPSCMAFLLVRAVTDWRRWWMWCCAAARVDGRAAMGSASEGEDLLGPLADLRVGILDEAGDRLAPLLEVDLVELHAFVDEELTVRLSLRDRGLAVGRGHGVGSLEQDLLDLGGVAVERVTPHLEVEVAVEVVGLGH